jgi:TPR repeat protein
MRGKRQLGFAVVSLVLLAACAGRGSVRTAAGPAPDVATRRERAAGAAGAASALTKPACAGFEDCKERCRDKNALACLWAGRYAERDGVAGAHFFYNKACAGERAEGCERAALVGDVLHLRETERACAHGIAEACERLGWAYQRGTSVPVDGARGDVFYQEAAKRYLAACQAGSGLDCAAAATLFDDGSGVTRDAARADELYRSACGLGDRFGCERSGAITTSATTADAACKPGATEACNRVGLRFEIGRELELDPKRAVAAYEKACDQKDARGCALLGFAYEVGLGVGQSDHEARRLYEIACDANEMQGCYSLGRFNRTGTGIARDLQTAANLFFRACYGSEDALGCRELTEMYESGEAVNVHGDSIIEGYHKACEKQDARACLRGATMLVEGKKVQRDATRGLELYDKACALGLGEACFAAAKLFQAGDLIPKNLDAAALWFQRGCDANDSESCIALRPVIFGPRKRK